MLMLCYFYCIPAAKFLYFAFGPILFLCAMFALKRGTRNQRPGLRLAAFIMMFCATFKTFIVDLFISTPIMKIDLKETACSVYKLPLLDCDSLSTGGVRIIQVAGLIAFALIMAVLAHYYTICMPPQKQRDTKPEEVHLRFFANVAFISILVMIAWQLAPWVGYLTVGCIPKLFTYIKWQELAVFDLCALAVGFWKLESCIWQFKVSEKERMRHLQNTWTPKDTLWMSVFLYLLTIGLAYVSHDILLKSGSTQYTCRAGEAKQNASDANDFDTGNANVQQ